MKTFRLKLERAKRHFKELHDQIQDYLDSEPIYIERSNDSNGSPAKIIRIRHHLSPDISLIVGDLVHNLRSSLDHIIIELCYKNYKFKNPPRDISFYIGKNQGDFTANLKNIQRFLPQNVVDDIARLKPYAGGNPDLWIIKELDSQDKHRGIVVTFATGSHLIMDVGSFFSHESEVNLPPMMLRFESAELTPIVDKEVVALGCDADDHRGLKGE